MPKFSCPLQKNSEKYPDEDALIWSGRSVGWNMLNGYVRSTARYFKEIGVRPGTRVAFFSKNSVEYVISLLAVWRVGAVAMPLSIHLPSFVLEYAVERFQPGFLFVDGSVTFASGKAKVFSLTALVSYQYTDEFLGREESFHPQVDDNAEAAVVLTSGSSGTPKGAVLSYGNLYANAVGANERIPFQPNDRWLLSLPLWHVSGLSIIFRALAGGGAVAVPAADESLEDAIARYRPTHVSLVPTQLKRLMGIPGQKKVLSFAKAILLGGAPIPTSLATSAVKNGISLYGTYGLTETASQVATGRIDENGVVDVRAIRGQEIRISPEGEVCVRGAGVFQKHLFGGSTDIFDADGWYHTGDRGEMSPDGCLKILGRKDNMFISGGENVFPEAIEKTLLAHPDIEQALVVAVEDGEFGRRPAAFVRFRGTVSVSPDGLTAFLKNHLARHEIPKCYFSWPGNSGESLKPDRKLFADMASRGQAKIIAA